MFLSFYWIDTSAGGQLVLEGIIRPVVNVSALTWLISANALLHHSIVHIANEGHHIRINI